MDDLERGVGLAGAGGHDQQHAALSSRNGLDRAVDGIELVVARGLGGGGEGVIEFGNALHFVAPAFPRAVACPQLLRGRELVERDVLLQHTGGQRGVAKHKAVTIAGETEGHVQQLGVVDGLLHARTHGQAGLFCLHDGQRDVGFQKECKVRMQNGGGITFGGLAAHHHTPGTQGVLGVNLVEGVPPGLHDGGADDLVTQVALG